MSLKNDKAKVYNPATGGSTTIPGQDIGSESGWSLDGFGGLVDSIFGVVDKGVDAYGDFLGAKNAVDLAKLEAKRDYQQAMTVDAMGRGVGNGVPQGSGSGPLPGLNNVLQAGGGGSMLLMLVGGGLLAGYALTRK